MVTLAPDLAEAVRLTDRFVALLEHMLAARDDSELARALDAYLADRRAARLGG